MSPSPRIGKISGKSAVLACAAYLLWGAIVFAFPTSLSAAPLARAPLPVCSLIGFASVGQSVAQTGGCTCGPLYCPDPAAADSAREQKKTELRALGYPERLLSLLDKYRCVACIRFAPDTFTITIQYKPGAGPSNGNGGKWTSESFQWTPQQEALARKEMRQGVIESFYIYNAAKACKCCDEPDPETRSDWNAALEINMDGVLSFTSASSLGPDPPEVTTVPPEWLQPVPQEVNYTKPQAHVMCPLCQKYADQLDDLWTQKLSILRAIDIGNRAAAERENQIAALQYQQLMSPQPQPALQQQIDDLSRINSQQAQDAPAWQAKLDEVNTEIAATQAQLLQCEATACSQTASVLARGQPPVPAPTSPPPLEKKKDDIEATNRSSALSSPGTSASAAVRPGSPMLNAGNLAMATNVATSAPGVPTYQLVVVFVVNSSAALRGSHPDYEYAQWNPRFGGWLLPAAYHPATSSASGMLAPPAMPQSPQASGGISYSIVSNGKSSGQALELQVLDATGRIDQAAMPQGLVLEPVKQGAAKPVAQRPPAGAHLLTQDVTSYCLEFAKLPPEAGMLYRIAPQAVQNQFQSILPLLQAAQRSGANDDTIQYGIWSLLEHWDQQKFTEMFVEHVRKNAQASNVTWTKQMEQAVTGLAPARWRDIAALLAQVQQLPGKSAPVN